MKKTHARRKFKKLLGQANHFLITTLIGLDHIEKNSNITKPVEFSTSWEPHNIKASAYRSREFVLNSALTWTVDSLDSYLTMIHRKPKVIQDKNFTIAMSKSGRSVYRKATNIGEYFKIELLLISMIELLVTWRNNLTHNFAENTIRPESERELQDNKELIKEKYSGLIIDDIFEKVYQGKSPSFKECASLIQATHKFVEIIDSKIIKQLDINQYSKNIYCLYFTINNEKRTSKVFGSPLNDRKKIITNILRDNGAFDEVNDEIIDTLVNLKVADIKEYNKQIEKEEENPDNDENNSFNYLN